MISIFIYAWTPSSFDYKLCYPISNCNLETIVELINNDKEWKSDLITSVFDVADANRNLRILLAREPHSNAVIWKCEATGEFSIRSAYKLLQINSATPN